MKPLFENLDQVLAQVKDKKIALFLDYDGTLTPIVNSPQEALCPKEAKIALETLSKMPQFHLAIVSGRALEDVTQLVGIKDIIYVGNHGYQISGLGKNFDVQPLPNTKHVLEKLKIEVNQKLKEYPGSFIEDKGATLSIHYRQVSLEQSIILEQLLYNLTESYLKNNKIHINLGKKVFEIKPAFDWNKGKAVLWILEKQKGFPIYIGDDKTDEDAFSAINDIGVSVYVGNQNEANTCAQYYVNTPTDVVKFLEHLQRIK